MTLLGAASERGVLAACYQRASERGVLAACYQRASERGVLAACYQPQGTLFIIYVNIGNLFFKDPCLPVHAELLTPCLQC